MVLEHCLWDWLTNAEQLDRIPSLQISKKIFFLLPYLALPLVCRRWHSLQLLFFLPTWIGKITQFHSVWIHFFLPPNTREGRPFGLSWNQTQFLLLHKRPL